MEYNHSAEDKFTPDELFEIANKFQSNTKIVTEEQLQIIDPALDSFYKALFFLTSNQHCDDLCINTVGKSIVSALFNRQIIINIFPDPNEFMMVTIEECNHKTIPVIHINQNFQQLLGEHTTDKMTHMYYLLQLIYEHFNGVAQTILSTDNDSDLFQMAIIKGRVIAGFFKRQANLQLTTAQQNYKDLFESTIIDH